jgi:hypothetical protein
MYFFFHLIAGIILGFLLGDILHDNRWLVPCTIGSVLPDLIDKPVGHVLLGGSVGYGRIIFHTLPVLILVLAAGIVLWRYRGSLLVIALGAGIFFHQLLDSMVNEPESWLYPFLGSPPQWRTYPPDYFTTLVLSTLSNRSEWFMGFIFLAAIVLYLKRDRVVAMARRQGKGLSLLMEGTGIVLWMISGLIFTYGLRRKILLPSGRFILSSAMIYSLVIALAAILIWRWGSALGKEETEKES